MINISQFSFTAKEFFRTDSALPVTAIRPLQDRTSKEIIGSTITVVIPARNFTSLNVKVANCTAHTSYQAGTSMSVSFEGLVVKPYALMGDHGILSGWSATASKATFSSSSDYL